MAIRNDFPFLIKHPNVAYFDSAATMLKPKSVIESVVDYYENLSSNIHRGDYRFAFETGERYENVRTKVAKFLNVDRNCVVFTSGASESLNLIAQGYGLSQLSKGDVVLLNEAEHASNTLPWFALKESIGIEIEFIKLDHEGRITLDSVKNAMHSRVKVVSIAHVTNVLGYENNIKDISKIVHENGSLLCVDGAQSVGHIKVDLKDLDIDFFAFSAHKMLGPTGVGVMIAKAELLEIMRPLNTGGGNNARYNACGDVVLKKAPAKFESGTPNIEGVLGFGAAIDYLENLGIEQVHSIIKPIHQRLVQGLMKMDHVELYNPNADLGIASFSIKGIFAQDVAAYLNSYDICVRSGEHCAKMLNGALHSEKSVRLSLYIYNTMEEVDRFLEVIESITLEKTINLYL